MHSIEGKWELQSGELDGFDQPCLSGTRLALVSGKLTVESETGVHYRRSYKIEDAEDPPQLHCNEGAVTYAAWIYKLGEANLELVYIDPGEPGLPTWAGFPPTSARVRKA